MTGFRLPNIEWVSEDAHGILWVHPPSISQREIAGVLSAVNMGARVDAEQAVRLFVVQGQLAIKVYPISSRHAYFYGDLFYTSATVGSAHVPNLLPCYAFALCKGHILNRFISPRFRQDLGFPDDEHYGLRIMKHMQDTLPLIKYMEHRQNVSMLLYRAEILTILFDSLISLANLAHHRPYARNNDLHPTGNVHIQFARNLVDLPKELGTRTRTLIMGDNEVTFTLRGPKVQSHFFDNNLATLNMGDTNVRSAHMAMMGICDTPNAHYDLLTFLNIIYVKAPRDGISMEIRAFIERHIPEQFRGPGLQINLPNQQQDEASVKRLLDGHQVCTMDYRPSRLPMMLNLGLFKEIRTREGEMVLATKNERAYGISQALSTIQMGFAFAQPSMVIPYLMPKYEDEVGDVILAKRFSAFNCEPEGKVQDLVFRMLRDPIFDPIRIAISESPHEPIDSCGQWELKPWICEGGNSRNSPNGVIGRK